MQLIQAECKTQLQHIEALYERAFPSCERKPFSLILEKQAAGCVDVFSIEENGSFLGLAITMKDNNLVLLDYFAISENFRGTGNGSAALQELFRFYSGKRFFLEIESTKASAENHAQRQKRKSFYLANGMTELGMEAVVFGTDMELLGRNTSLTFQEYYGVYEHIYGRKKADNLISLPRS